MPRPAASISTCSKPVMPCSSLLVALLQPGLADVVGAAVVGVDAQLLEPLLVALVDAADVADHVRGELAVRVLAEQARLDVDAGEAVAVGGEPRHLLVGEARADRQALGVARLDAAACLKRRAVARLDVDHLAELVDGASPGRCTLRGEDLQRVGRVVARQHDAVAVEDQPAVGHDRHDRDAVVLGLGGGSSRAAPPAGRRSARAAARRRRARRRRRRRCAAGSSTARARWFLSSAKLMR